MTSEKKKQLLTNTNESTISISNDEELTLCICKNNPLHRFVHTDVVLMKQKSLRCSCGGKLKKQTFVPKGNMQIELSDNERLRLSCLLMNEALFCRQRAEKWRKDGYTGMFARELAEEHALLEIRKKLEG